MKEQGEKLEELFYKWKGEKPQVDDIIFIGLKI